MYKINCYNFFFNKTFNVYKGFGVRWMTFICCNSKHPTYILRSHWYISVTRSLNVSISCDLELVTYRLIRVSLLVLWGTLWAEFKICLITEMSWGPLDLFTVKQEIISNSPEEPLGCVWKLYSLLLKKCANILHLNRKTTQLKTFFSFSRCITCVEKLLRCNYFFLSLKN